MKSTVFLKLGLYSERKTYKSPKSNVIFNDIQKNTDTLYSKRIELCLSIDDYINDHEQNIKMNVMPPEIITPMHNHDYYEINYITKGKSFQVVGEENYVFEPGTMLIMHPSVFHATYMAKGSMGFNILIRKEFIEKLNHLFSTKCENNPLERLISKSSYMIYKSKNTKFFDKYFLNLDEKQKELLTKNGMQTVSSGVSLADLLRRPSVTYEMLGEIDLDRPALPLRVAITVEVTIKYEGYIKRQINEVQRREKMEQKRIPEDIDYGNIKGLRLEAAQKLAKLRPLTIGQASRISGVNPADVTVLLIYLGLK